MTPKTTDLRALNVRWRRWPRETGQLHAELEQQKESPAENRY
jgi:hypothetical protein